ncbi:MAG: glycoside hydrolase family 3 N-terminal domain-containing protein [Bacteroidota bacterium]|nr:glycoside hydrolase family 3 N-terminal domain-containing protein [Bacteroidota bacterium]
MRLVPLFSLILISFSCFTQEKQAIFYLEKDSVADVWVDSVMLSMNSKEKIGQLFMAAAYSNTKNNNQKHINNLIQNYNIGGVMFLQGSPTKQAILTNHYQSISKTPLMVAMDAEWGVAMRLDSSLSFPWQMTLGAINERLNKDLIYDMSAEIARQCKLLGVNINFAPVVDVNSNPKNPIINNRSFGENPKKVALYSNIYMKGLQDNHILACAKHFPGHGDTDIDSHKDLPIVKHSKYHLLQTELRPYKKLINSALGSIMVGHLNVPSLDASAGMPASLSSKIIGNLLRKEMGFEGLVITDALNMEGVKKIFNDKNVDLQALLAGNDILLMSEDVDKGIEAINDAIKENAITIEDINKKCRKILLAKYWMGLNKYKPLNTQHISSEIITPKTRILNKKLMESSITLLQNYNDLLPLKSLDTLNIASISIGEEGTDFHNMLKNYAPVKTFYISEKASKKEQAELLNKLAKYNLVIVGLHKSNKSAWEDYTINRDVDIFLQSLALQSKIIVSVFANPYSVNSFLFVDNFDAFLLGYQNSNLGQSLIAQAIFGGVSFTGKLPVSTRHFKIFEGIRTDIIRMRYPLLEEMQKLDYPKLYKIDSLVEHAMAEEAIPGCQILIAQEGNIFFNKSYGYHTYARKKEVDNSDIYDLASITKIISTLPALMRMSDQNVFDLEDQLGDIINLDNNSKKELTHKEILAHQAGLQAWIPFYRETLVKDSISGLVQLNNRLYSSSFSDTFSYKVADNIYMLSTYRDSIFNKIINSELLEKEYRYSDLGYYIYKNIIEDYYKITLDEYIQNTFFKKLGMENLGYLPKGRIKEERIIPTENDFEFRGQLIKGYVHDMGAAMLGGVGGHAGIFSNANDLAKFMQMYLQGGMYAEERYIKESTIRKFSACQFCEEDNRRGAGFDKPALVEDEGSASQNASLESFGHSGFTGTLAWADPETKIIYIFLSNRIHPSSTNTKLLDMNLRTDIMEIIFDSIYE